MGDIRGWYPGTSGYIRPNKKRKKVNRTQSCLIVPYRTLSYPIVPYRALSCPSGVLTMDLSRIHAIEMPVVAPPILYGSGSAARQGHYVKRPGKRRFSIAWFRLRLRTLDIFVQPRHPPSSHHKTTQPIVNKHITHKSWKNPSRPVTPPG